MFLDGIEFPSHLMGEGMSGICGQTGECRLAPTAAPVSHAFDCA
jgi:hypothetical protein